MYKYQKIEGTGYPLFYFITSSQFEYSVSFLKMDETFLKEITIYNICLDCVNSNTPKKDIQVGKTVCTIINNFLSKNRKCLLAYVCDSADNKHYLRQRIFETWYNKFGSSDYHVKNYNVHIEEFKVIYYSSVIFDVSIYNEKIVDETYGNALRRLSSKG